MSGTFYRDSAPPAWRAGVGAEGPHIRFFLAFPLFFFFGFALPLLMTWAVGASSADRLEPALAWGVAAYSAARLSLLAALGEMRLLSLTFWIFVYVWLGIAPLTQLLSEAFPHRGLYDSHTVVWAFALVAIGILGFEIGHNRAGRSGFADRLERLLASRTLSAGRTTLVALAAIVVAATIVFRLGGLETFLASREGVSHAIRRVTGADFQDRFVIALMLVRVPPFIAMYLLWWLWLRRRAAFSVHGKLLLWTLLLASFGINVLVSNPINAPRYWFGTVILAVVLITVPFRRRWWFAAWVLILAGALLVVFPYADLFRRETVPVDVQFAGMSSFVDKADYDAFQQLLNAQVFVDEQGFRYGRQLCGTLLFWVPRRIWQDKPLPSGGAVAEVMDYQYTNLSMPLWGEAYLDGGPLLVFLFLAGHGFLVGCLEKGYLRRRWGEDTPVVFFVPIFAAYQFLLLRGALMSSFGNLVAVAGLLFLATRPVSSRRAAGGGTPSAGG